jgi:hypothetical protein
MAREITPKTGFLSIPQNLLLPPEHSQNTSACRGFTAPITPKRTTTSVPPLYLGIIPPKRATGGTDRKTRNFSPYLTFLPHTNPTFGDKKTWIVA